MVLKNGDELMPAHERKPARTHRAYQRLNVSSLELSSGARGTVHTTSLSFGCIYKAVSKRRSGVVQSGAVAVRLFSRSNEGGVGTRATRRGEGGAVSHARRTRRQRKYLFAVCSLFAPLCPSAPAPRHNVSAHSHGMHRAAAAHYPWQLCAPLAKPFTLLMTTAVSGCTPTCA